MQVVFKAGNFAVYFNRIFFALCPKWKSLLRECEDLLSPSSLTSKVTSSSSPTSRGRVCCLATPLGTGWTSEFDDIPLFPDMEALSSRSIWHAGGGGGEGREEEGGEGEGKGAYMEN